MYYNFAIHKDFVRFIRILGFFYADEHPTWLTCMSIPSLPAVFIQACALGRKLPRRPMWRILWFLPAGRDFLMGDDWMMRTSYGAV